MIAVDAGSSRDETRDVIAASPRVPAAADEPPGETLLDATVGWLAKNLRWFDSGQWERFLPRRPFPEGALLELLVLCRVLRRGRLRDHPMISDAIELAGAVVASDLFLAQLGYADEKFPYRVYLVALLADLGRSVSVATERVNSVLSCGSAGRTGAWNTPLTRLELRYALDLGGFDSVLPSVADLIGDTVSAAAPDPLYLRDDEVYALTHTVFYGSDFAACPVPRGPADPETLRVLLGARLALGDLDLAGELLLCLLVVRPGDCAITRHGWDMLSRCRLAAGSVPGPLYDHTKRRALRGEPADVYEFGTCHHTTMVAAMAASERERRHDN